MGANSSRKIALLRPGWLPNNVTVGIDAAYAPVDQADFGVILQELYAAF
jgi:hypothetical protein